MAQWPASMGAIPPGMYYGMPTAVPAKALSSQSAFPGMQQPTMMPIAAHSRNIPQSLAQSIPRGIPHSMASQMGHPSPGPPPIVENRWDFPNQNSAVKSTPMYQVRPEALSAPPSSSPAPMEREIKTEKDPAAPTKPPPAFLKWSIEERVEIKKQLGNLSFAEMGKELGNRWASLNPEVKQFYQERYLVEKADFDKASAAYSGTMGIPSGSGKKKGRKNRDPGAPKKPAPMFLKWSMEERSVIKEELGPLKPGDMGKELGRRWAVLHPDVKQLYADRYKQEKKEYDVLRGKYKPGVNGAGGNKGIRTCKKPPPPFLKWSQFERLEIKKEMGNLSFTEMGRELGKRWASITPEVKQVYKEKYKQEKDQYDAQCREDRGEPQQQLQLQQQQPPQQQQQQQQQQPQVQQQQQQQHHQQQHHLIHSASNILPDAMNLASIHRT